MIKKEDALGIKVSGNIISELSDRIPSNFMAFNELIKNAYDADAPSVSIKIFTKEKKIIVEDTGIGMDEAGIRNLLHIARSNKNYAVERENGRITQGEKGLGALATFHFGNCVTWETSQDSKVAYRFTVEKDKILNTEDINEYQTEIEELPASFIGTKITIVGVQDFNFMLKTIKNKKTTTKLVRSIYDSNGFSDFKVDIFIDGEKIVVESDLVINESNNAVRVYSVEYDSSKEINKISFFYNGVLVMEKDFILDKTLHDFSLKCNLNIYDFRGTIRSSNFPALYHKEQEKDDITPLVYINQGLFKNYTLFDVDIARKKRSGQALPQITGEIEIKTQNDKLMFNADRTEINENVITEMLKTEIERLNILIQETGAEYKLPFIEMNGNGSPTSLIKEERIDVTGLDSDDIELIVKNNISKDVFKKHTKYTINNKTVVYKFFNYKVIVELFTNEDRPDESKSKKEKDFLKPAIIKLSQDEIKKKIGSTAQINLYDYIVEDKTLDSKGNKILIEKIVISDNKGLMKSNNILPVVTTPQNVEIVYKYDDENTGETSTLLVVEFIHPPRDPIIGKDSKESLIHTHGIGNFKITFDVVASRLVNQINSLAYDNYLEMISCSLRTLFELGVDSIRNKNTVSANLKTLQSALNSNNDLHDNVKSIVEFIKIKKHREKIVNYLRTSCTNINFHTLNNIANSDRIATHASESNLGAHKGTRHLTKERIIDITNDVSAYLIFVEGIIGSSDDL